MSEEKLSAFNKVKTCDLSNYSTIILIGGDGTLHEGVNGMLMREDKLKVPVAFVPSGTGNDTCSCLNIKSVNDALESIKKGQTIGIDVIKVLVDYENEE